MIVNQHKPLTALASLTHAMKLERSEARVTAGHAN